MCIIVFSPANTELPTDDILRECFRCNPDGAGYMYPDAKTGKVRIKKGFMTVGSLLDSLDSLEDTTTIPMVIHFRIGTQGLNDPSNTHPFPVTDNGKTLGLRQSYAEVGLAHNGFIPSTCYGSMVNGKKITKSDTFYFVRDYAAYIARNPQYYKDTDKLILLEKIAESKLCILSSDGHVEMIGDFINDKTDGCFYSNSSYVPYTYTGKYSSGLSGNPQYNWGMGDSYDSDYMNGTDGYFDSEGQWRKFDESQWVDVNQLALMAGSGEALEEISAMFMPIDWQVFDPRKGVAVSSIEDAYVIDLYGNVYIWDDEWNGIVKIEDAEAFDGEWVPMRARVRDTNKFRLLVKKGE